MAPRHTAIWDADDGEDQRIRDALFSVDATERHVWLTIGMAIEAHYGQAGRALWDEWSLTAKDKHSPDDQDRVWRSFKGSGISIGTLFHYAKHGGWEDSTKGLYEEWCRRQAPPKEGAAETLAFPATAFADVKLNGKERNYLIIGAVATIRLVVVWGPPKSGKCSWCMDVVPARRAGLGVSRAQGAASQRRICRPRRAQWSFPPV